MTQWFQYEESLNTNYKEYMDPYVHCSIIYNYSEIWKQPKCPFLDE